MNKYSLYNPQTGQITGHYQSSDPQQPPNSIPEHHDAGQYYVHNGVPTLLPPRPDERHLLDWNTKTWYLDIETIKAEMRERRNGLLSIVDRVNPIWWSSLSALQQQQLSEYRTALLNVPQQVGFPLEIQWPDPPKWFFR